MAAFEWLSIVDAYDELVRVNTAQEMTGIRNLFFAASDYDLGNILAMLIALVLMTILCVPVIRARSCAPEAGMGANESLCLITLASAATIAITPLHIYDFTIVVVILFVLLPARSLEMVTRLIGFALILRANDVAKMAAFYSLDTKYYGGSKLATTGAMMLLLAVFRIIKQQRVGGTNQVING